MEHVTSPTNPTPISAPADILARFDAARAEYFGQEFSDDGPPKAVQKGFYAAKRAVLAARGVSLSLIKARVDVFAMEMGDIDVHNPEEISAAKDAPKESVRFVARLYEHLCDIEKNAPEQIPTLDWMKLCVLSEGLAKACANDQWPDYAINPQAISRLSRTLERIQQPVRDLAELYCGPALAAAVEAVYFGKEPAAEGANTDFDAASWIDAFERIPGHNMRGTGPTYTEPEAWPEGDMTSQPLGRALWSALSTEQKAAVRREGARRRPLIPPGTDFSKMVFRPVERGGEVILHAAE